MLRRPSPSAPRSLLRGVGQAVLQPLGYALLAVGLLVGVVLVSAGQVTSTVRQEAQVRVTSHRDAAVRSLQRITSDRVQQVAAWAEDPDVRAALTSGAGPRTDAALAKLAAGTSTPAAFLTDLEGRNVAVQPSQPELIGKDFSFRDWYQGVSRTGAPYVSSGYASAAKGNPLVVALSVPVVVDGRRAGYLTSLWDLASVRDLVSGAARDDGVLLAVNDQAGRLLSQDLAVDARGEPLPVPVDDSASGDDLRATVLVPGLGWTVTASLPEAVALRPADEVRRSLLVVLAVAVLLLLAAAGLIVRGGQRQRLADQAADEERERLKAVFDGSPIGILEGLPDGTVLAANEAFAELVGYDREEVLALNAAALAHPDSAPAVAEALHRVVNGQVSSYSAERTYRHRDGTPVPVLSSVVVLRDLTGQIRRMVAFAVDQREQRRAAEVLQRSESRFRTVFDESLLAALLVNPAGEVVRVNAAMARMLEEPVEELVGSHLLERVAAAHDRAEVGALLHEGCGALSAEMALVGPGSDELWGRVAMSWFEDEQSGRILLVQVEDVTARRAAELRLTELALHDELTGLANRRLLVDRCQQAIAQARSGRAGTSSSVGALFLDLDGFKAVNDRAGHEAGDALLVEVSQALARVLRPEDTIARVGGDEFVVLVGPGAEIEELRVLAARLVTAARRQVVVLGTSLSVTASVGIAQVDVLQEPTVQPEQLLRRADAAMYRAKERGRDRHDVFDEELRDCTEARHRLEVAVQEGLAHDGVHLVFQSVVDVDAGVLVGAEALMRMSGPGGTTLPTLPLVLAAESAGLAEALGARVLHLALDAARTWPDALSVAVNVSARQLTGHDFAERTEQALQAHGVDPRRLVLEITETSILRAGPSALAGLNRLRSQGVRIAIDDFGTAYATLQNLTVLPVDIVKVDASFTAGIPHQRAHSAVVRGVASMARELGIPCVVEGVETPAQLAAIRDLGVQAQGWLWGRPRGAGHIPGLIPFPRSSGAHLRSVDAPAG